MLKETIYLYHTPKEKAIEHLVSNYDFRVEPNQIDSPILILSGEIILEIEASFKIKGLHLLITK